MATTNRHRMTARKHRPDYGFVLVMGLLLLVGIIVIFSIGPALQQSVGITVGKQFISIFIGILAFAATALIPISFWHRIQGLLLVVALAATLVLLLPGEAINPDVNGATRWLVVGPISFQPSELLKFSMIIYMASFLAKKAKHHKINDFRETIIPIAVILSILGVFIVLFQRDLGTMLVLVAVVCAMLYIAGVRLSHLAALLGGMLAAGSIAILAVPHRLSRFLTFLNPSADLEGAGYHVNQALIAIGSGGLFGLGLGQSVQAYGYLPEAANDSIFAIYAEKFGFIGAVITLVLFGILLLRIVKVIEHAPNTYTRLIATGVFAWLAAHAVINIGAMLSLVPLTGITLPFLSYGGSSMVFTMAALGLVFNISRYTTYSNPAKRGESTASNRNRRRQRRTRYATSVRHS